MTEIEKFIEYLMAKKLSESTIEQYTNYFMLFQKDVDRSGLDQELINKFVLKHASNVTRSFLNNLFAFFGITELVVPKVTGRKKKRLKKTISPQEIKELRKVLYRRNEKFGLMFDLTNHAGLRKSEVLGIEGKDIDFEEWVKDKKKRCVLKIRGKGDKERFVAIPPKLTQRIINYMAENNRYEKIFKASKSLWHRAFSQANKKLGYNYTLHDLRRSRATRWLKEGKNLIQVKNRLGHESVQTTQLYINPESEEELKLWIKE